jgi:AcrR family transcriptional regulator
MKGKNQTGKDVRRIQALNRQSEIYRKALDLFVKKGYDGTSISMIAKVLGMSKANLYYYFPSKENLLYKIYLDYLERCFIPILDEAENLSNPEERLVCFLRKFTLSVCNSPASRVLISQAHNLNGEHYYEIRSVWKRSYELFSGCIKDLQESGRARKFRDSFLTFLGSGMAFWIAYWFDYSRQTNAEELADTVVQTFLHGLLLPGNNEKH